MSKASGINREALAVLLLAAALVLLIGLWAFERVADDRAAGPGNDGQLGQGGDNIEWKLVTTWPKNLPGLGHTPEVFAQMVREMSSGRLNIRVYGAGEIVPPFEVFDAVSSGVAQVGHGASYYWKGKIPSSVFFTAVPFGMTAQEMNGWLHYGGGMEIWREVYAPAGLVPFAGGSSGVQMAGWFNREIKSLDDLKGLRMRIPGLAGEVFSAAGGEAVRIPGGEVYTALQTGVIDAVEWVGPYNDLALGLHEIAEYYYYPGWHEPGSMLEFIVNEDALNALPQDLQAIVRYAARAANQDMLDEFTARNNRALREMIEVHKVKLRRLPDDVLAALYRGGEEAMARMIEKDPLAARVNASFQAFLKDVRAYHEISEQSYINVRRDLMGPLIDE
ncbi:TRAP transporter substrate-binding protein [Congregibacter litoralis]|uniref:TRAP-type mannitol/chloroaromatic compound transport system, periplasmic component n=1 Tax=Congregibacter litoralis KT71 TaxID=314285 RepID=A4A988_9GAMM|nr:TRAP transporter substrate-binding protein DctP [Congregibacter litoralis]EAQ97630.2 TRAP-type mannitol/chloroaromatic compound transport system, periplasmic component [Congregibacter litoralis KT71]